MCTGLAGVAAEGAVSAIIAAEVRERDKDFTGIRDGAGPEALSGLASRGQQVRKLFLRAANQASSRLARNRLAGMNALLEKRAVDHGSLRPVFRTFPLLDWMIQLPGVVM